MNLKTRTSLLALTGALLVTCIHADPLLRHSEISPLVSKRLLTSLASVGNETLIAVGQRGHVLVSSRDGSDWSQSSVPVSSDLTAVQFVDDKHGFAVGHDGVILGSDDGGVNWRLLLDGKSANALVLKQLKQKEGGSNKQLLAEAQRNVDAGPDKPWLDLYFSSPKRGFVVGAYNLILETQDGGQSWSSWYDRSDNSEKLLNLYGIREHKRKIYAVGEAGLVMRLDQSRQRFVRLHAGYAGSFFGLLDAGESLIAYGMRGQVRSTRDEGKTWQQIPTGLPSTITAAARSADGRIWLADQLGNVSVSHDRGQSFLPMKPKAGIPVASMIATKNTLVFAGPRGMQSLPFPKD